MWQCLGVFVVHRHIHFHCQIERNDVISGPVIVLALAVLSWCRSRSWQVAMRGVGRCHVVLVFVCSIARLSVVIHHVDAWW